MLHLFILPSFEALLPGIEMHGAEFGHVGISHVNVETLALIDEGTPSRGQIEYLILSSIPVSS